MKDVLLIGLLGGAAWFLWNAISSAPGTSTPVASGSAPTPPLNTALVNALNAAIPGYWNPQQGANEPSTYQGTATASQWSWILTNVVNKGSSAPNLPFGLTQQITAAQYVAAMQSAGLAGYRARTWRVA